MRPHKPRQSFGSKTSRAHKSTPSSTVSRVSSQRRATKVKLPSPIPPPAKRAVFIPPKPLPGSSPPPYHTPHNSKHDRVDAERTEDYAIDSPLPIRVKSSRQPTGWTPIRPTGPHDDALARARGTYREPSLRRGSGLIVETPKMVRKDIEKRQKGTTRGHHRGQQIPTPPTSSLSDANRVAITPRRKSNVKDFKDSSSPDKTPRPRIGDNQGKLEGVEKPVTDRRNSTKALPSAQTPQMSWITIKEKEHVIRACLEHQQTYLDLPATMQCNEEVFWKLVYDRLQLEVKKKMKAWHQLKDNVDNWCNQRREQMNNGILSSPYRFRQELDEAIDCWNTIWARRFCQLHRGVFEVGAWPAIEDKISSIVQSEIYDFAINLLAERRQDLAALARPPVLSGHSSVETYHNYVEHLQGMVEAGGRSSFQIQESEAVMAFVLTLRPDLESVMRQYTIGDNQEDEPNTDEDSDPESDVVMYDDGPVHKGQREVVLSSIEPRTPVTTPRTINQLGEYERAYLQALKSEREGQLQTPKHGHNLATKRKPLAGLKNETKGDTPKRRRTAVQAVESPGSAASSFSFPPLEALIDTGRGTRDSGRRGSIVLGEPSPAMVGAAPSTKDDHSPVESKSPKSSVFVRPSQDGSSSRRALEQEHSQAPTRNGRKKSSAQSAAGRSGDNSRVSSTMSTPANKNSRHIISETLRGNSPPQGSPIRFRESTADFYAMTPASRTAMLFEEVKWLRGQQSGRK